MPDRGTRFASECRQDYRGFPCLPHRHVSASASGRQRAFRKRSEGVTSAREDAHGTLKKMPRKTARTSRSSNGRTFLCAWTCCGAGTMLRKHLPAQHSSLNPRDGGATKWPTYLRPPTVTPHRKPVESQGTAATIASPRSKAIMYPHSGFMPSTGFTRPIAQAA